MKVPFGQSKSNKMKASLNQGMIRTDKGIKVWVLSERRSLSDNIRRKKLENVRMKVSFGQSKSKKRRISPNPGFIQKGSSLTDCWRLRDIHKTIINNKYRLFCQMKYNSSLKPCKMFFYLNLPCTTHRCFEL